MQRALDFDQSPQLAVPLPFFLNVPAFALLAGALATWAGPDLWSSRWGGATLAVTHLWTLGILGSAMLGALIQILAVACNVRVRAARGVAAAVHASLTLGTLLLAAGFLGRWARAWHAAILLLGFAFGLFLFAVGRALWQDRHDAYPGAREILVPVRAALLALGLTVLMGLMLAAALAAGLALPAWVDRHAAWGLLGWGGLLVMGMSFQLLPIFQVTELYPRRLIRGLPLVLVIVLVLWTGSTALAVIPAVVHEVLEALLALGYALWAGVTLQRLWTRKRPKPEATTLFWYLGTTSLLVSALLWASPWQAARAGSGLVPGTLFIVGVLGSVINGMLYKIMPFLLWKHVQDAIPVPDDQPALARQIARNLPKLAAYIPERHAQAQWLAHSLVIVSWTLAAAGWKPAAAAAGPLLLLSAGALTWNFGQALQRYSRVRRVLATWTPPLRP